MKKSLVLACVAVVAIALFRYARPQVGIQNNQTTQHQPVENVLPQSAAVSTNPSENRVKPVSIRLKLEIKEPKK